MNAWQIIITIWLFVLLSDFQTLAMSWDPLVESRDTDYRTSKITVEGFATASFIKTNNKRIQVLNSFFFALSGNTVLSINKSKCDKFLELRTDLGYTKFTDSIWIKNTDNLWLLFSYRTVSEKKFRNSINASLRTQLTDTWLSIPNYTGKNERQWRSGPLTPGTTILSYGLNYRFDERTDISVSYASLKIYSFIPKPESQTPVFIRAGKVSVNSEYGFNFQLRLEEPINHFISVENRTSFFATGLKKESMIFDFQNRIWVNIYRNIRVRIDSKFFYDALQATGIQSKYELLVGIFFDNKNKLQRNPE